MARDRSKFILPGPVPVEPDPTPQPVVPAAGRDRTQFIKGDPSAAHTSFIDALQGQAVPPVDVRPPQEAGDPEAGLKEAWQQELSNRARMGDGGPKQPFSPSPWNTYEEFRDAEIRRSIQNREAEQAQSMAAPYDGSPANPDNRENIGLGGAFASDLSHGLNRLGSMIARGQLAPDRALEDANAAQQALYKPRTFGEQVTGGLGGSVPALAAIAASRGRTLAAAPAMEAMAVPFEVGATSFVQNMADPNVTPQQNISSSLIEALMTRAGGSFEPGFKTPAKQLPAQIGKEGFEEGATGGLQDLSTQVNDPEAVATGRGIDFNQFLNSTAVSTASGSLAAGAMSPLGMRREAPATLPPSLPVDQDIEDMAQTKTDIRPLDVQAIESQLAQEAGIPDWVDEETRNEIKARFRPDERGQIPSLDVQDFNDPDHLEALRSRVRKYLDTASSESDKDQYNAVASALDEAPDAPKPKINKITGRPSYVEPELQDDASIAEVANSAEDVTPEFSPDTTEISPRRIITPEPSQSGFQEGRVVIPAKQEPYETRDVAIKPGAPKTPTTELKKFLSPKGVIAYNSMSDLERQSPEVQSTLEHLSKYPDPGGDVKNLNWARDIARNKRMKPKPAASRNIETRPEPKESFDVPDEVVRANREVQEQADFAEPQGEYKSPEPVVPAASKPNIRGKDKGQEEARKFFGPALATPAKLPSGFEEAPVRVFKDAGMHTMHVKSAGDGKHYVAWDNQRGKAILVTKTDAKGRQDAEGSEYRPLDSAGNVRTVEGNDAVPKFDSIDEAVEFAGKFLPAPKGVEPVEGQAIGNQDVAVTPEEPDLDNEEPAPAAKPTAKSLSREARKAELTKKMINARTTGGLTDEEVAELEELEKPEPAAKSAPAAQPETRFKKVANSPLTPALREEIESSVVEDMPGSAVGRMVENLVTQELKRKPSREELTAALRDLIENGIITKEQSVIPGSDVTARAIGPQDLINLVGAVFPKAGDLLSRSIQDLNEKAQLHVEQKDALKPGAYGYTSRKIAKAIVRALSPFGVKGNGFVDAMTRLNHLMGARAIAARFPAFRPVLKVAQQAIDNSRIAFQNAYNRLASFRELEGKDRFQVNGALIQFRLEDRKPADFGKPVTYEDERGKRHTYTLTPEQIAVVKDVYRSNKMLLRGYVKTLLRVLSLPPGTTSKNLEIMLATGKVSPAAKAVLIPLRILEEGAENYVPLKRFGEYMRATVMGPSINGKKPKAIKFIKAENLNDYRRQIDDAMAAHPGAKIVSHEEITTDQKSEAHISEGDLATLAEVAGIPATALQDFLDAGLSDYFATRGVRARFAGASKLPGFSHDMLRANANHAKQMTEAIMRLAHRAAMEERIKAMPAGDPLLKEYAQRFVERIDTPIPKSAATVRQITTLFYLGFNAVTALVNASSSMVFAPAIAFAASRSPLRAAKVFAQAASRQADALAHILGRGALTGINQAEDAAKSYDKENPALAKALREAEKAGVFADTFDREAEEVAKFGKSQGWTKVKDNLAGAYMHFFSKIETANRLSAFIGGYQMYEDSKGHKAFNTYVDNLGFDGNKPEEFGEFFSDFNNFRMDKTDMPSWAQGTFQKDEKGRTKFAPSVVRPMAYALKSWSFNYIQQQALVLRAALKGGLIDKALYGAIAASLIAMFGATNMIPGGQTVDAVAKYFSGDLKAPSERIAETGSAGRAAMTGAAGVAANLVFGERAGKYIDQLSARMGPGNVIPGSLDSLIAPAGVVTSLTDSAAKIGSGDTPRQLEGAAALLGKEPGRLMEMANMLTGTRGKTSKTGATIVPSESTALPGMPSLDIADMVAYGGGLTPPAVQGAYRLKQLNEDMKTANDKFQARVVNEIADAALKEDYEAIEKVVAEIEAENAKAIKAEQFYKVIDGDALKQSVQLEIRSRLLGPADLRFVPVKGRQIYQEAVDDFIPED